MLEWILRLWLRSRLPEPTPAPVLQARLHMIRWEASIALVALEDLPMMGETPRLIVRRWLETTIRICDGPKGDRNA